LRALRRIDSPAARNLVARPSAISPAPTIATVIAPSVAVYLASTLGYLSNIADGADKEVRVAVPSLKRTNLDSVELQPVEFFEIDARSNELVVREGRRLVVELYEASTGTFEWNIPGEEVLYVLDGEEQMEDLDAGETFTLKKGDFIHLLANRRVRVTYRPDKPFRALIVSYKDDAPLPEFPAKQDA
jgi:uncharacterized cupin superfamily protein